MTTTKQSPSSTEDTSFFSTTEGIVILALLAAIVLLLFLMVPVLYVTLRKCGVIKIARVAPTADRGTSSMTWHTGMSKRTQTRLTGQDIDKLQKAKPSLDEYKGKPPSKPRNSNSTANEDSRDYSPEVLPRWRDVDPDWSDPWTSREPAGYTYIRPDVEFVAG